MLTYFDFHLNTLFITLCPKCDISIKNSEKKDFLILSSPFHIHSILKLAPVLSQKSEKMRLVCTCCSSTAKTSTVTPIFYFMILIRTVLPFDEKKIVQIELSRVE